MPYGKVGLGGEVGIASGDGVLLSVGISVSIGTGSGASLDLTKQITNIIYNTND